MGGLSGQARRVIVSHTAAALSLSLPWPLLLVLVAQQTDNPLLLGLAGAARMLPYVVCSWAAGRLADVVRRDTIVRLTLLARGLLLVAGAVGVVTDHVWTAVVCTTLAVAVATPAYPALVAAMPRVAGPTSRRATDLLVTIEVAAFVVGSALGGLLLLGPVRTVVPWLPVVLVVVSAVVLHPVRMPKPARTPGEPAPSAYAALRTSPAARRAIGAMAGVNFVDGLVALALLPFALRSWDAGESGYGLATGVLGFSALGAPLLCRWGRTPTATTRTGLFLLALGTVAIAPAPGVWWALPPLALTGAASVAIESSATALIQDELPDEVRATVLGLTDTVIVGAALVGALVAPAADALLGPQLLLVVLAVGTLGLALGVRPPSRTQAPATVGFTRGEAHARPVAATTRTSAPVVRIPAPRRPDDPVADRERLRRVGDAGERPGRQPVGHGVDQHVGDRQARESAPLRRPG